MASAPNPSILARLAQAYMERERQRVGIPQEQQAAREAETVDLMRRAQAARIAQQMEMAPAEQSSEIDLRSAQTDYYRAGAGARETPKAGTPHYERDAAGNVTAVVPQPDGTFKQTPVGAIGTPQREPVDRPGAMDMPMWVTNKKTGEQAFVPKSEVLANPALYGQAATADMRNTEYQAGAVEPALNLVKASLDEFEKASAGGLPGAPSAMIPGTAAYFAKSRFQDQAKALLGAIVARQAGEGSRLSDEDRVAYSQASTLVNSTLMLPGGIEEARGRLLQAEHLLNTILRRRKLAGAGAEPGAPPPPGAEQTRVVNGVTYRKVPGGWQKVQQ